MNQYAAIASHVPTWVPILFVALLAYGISQSFERSMALRRTIVIPLVLLALSFYGALTTFPSQVVALLAWAAGVAAVVAASYGRIDVTRVSYAAAAQRFRVPGSWVPLILMMALFALKFGVGMETAMHPELRADRWAATWVSALYGVCAGGFLARSMALWTVARQAGANHRVLNA